MIRVSFSLLVGCYILFWLIVFFTAWFFQKLPNSLSSLGIGSKVVRQCSICTYTYFLSHDNPITRCPFCGTLNKRVEAESGDNKSSQ